MLETLLKLYYEAHREYQSLNLELSHNKITDWTLFIEHGDSNTTIFYLNSPFLSDLIAQGYVALRRWIDDKDIDKAPEFLDGIL